MQTATRRNTKDSFLYQCGPGAIFMSGSTVTFEDDTYFARNRASSITAGGKAELPFPAPPQRRQLRRVQGAQHNDVILEVLNT